MFNYYYYVFKGIMKFEANYNLRSCIADYNYKKPYL